VLGGCWFALDWPDWPEDVALGWFRLFVSVALDEVATLLPPAEPLLPGDALGLTELLAAPGEVDEELLDGDEGVLGVAVELLESLEDIAEPPGLVLELLFTAEPL